MKPVAAIIAFASTILFINCAMAQDAPKHEFRAVWIATVENIDWPSRKGLPVAQQKEEFIRILDMHYRNGMNAIIMQIRPVADAFYPSTLEPWSEYLNGKQGLPPTPYYDPLQFMIEETHKRGMEFHAWFNPYRAVFHTGASSVSPSHITRIHKDWAVTYGKYKWFDPALPQVREHVARVIRDVVTRYDIDAVHFDDYFYPYKINGRDFPDGKSYALYGKGMSKADWRRSNVDSIIKLLSETIKAANPRVKFGISPFGIWRNKKQDPRGS
ncbi:MAG TPA: family 10 glycosylhydrolase, partial [Chitinophagaceae bacterium]